MVSLFAHNRSMRGMQIFLDPGETIDAGTRLDWDFLEPRSFLVGSPARVIERLKSTAKSATRRRSWSDTHTTASTRKRPCATSNGSGPRSCRTFRAPA